MNFSSNFSAPFIHRPVATTLITIAIFLSGAVAFRFLPVAPLPQIDFPTIAVGAGLPGASPETMASAVATPLERQFGRIAGVTQMTSSSGFGNTNVILQFDLNRDINAAARDVQAAINAARTQLPADLPGQPGYRKVNPADAPIILLSLTSTNIPPAQLYDAADSILAQKLAQVEGVGQVFTWGSSRPAVRVTVNPNLVNSYGISLETVRKMFRPPSTRPALSFRLTVSERRMIGASAGRKAGGEVCLGDCLRIQDSGKWKVIYFQSLQPLFQVRGLGGSPRRAYRQGQMFEL